MRVKPETWTEREKFLKNHLRGHWTATQMRIFGEQLGVRGTGGKDNMLKMIDEAEKVRCN